jgi:protein-tyrosine phosphatase
MAKTRVCFVCMGNICRSPLAEGVFTHLVKEAGREGEFHIESFGVGAWHVGEPADYRSQATARRHGITLTGRAQQFKARDFERFDQVWALDGEVADFLRRMAPTDAARAKVRLLREHDPEAGAADPEHGDLDVPDPYYGGPEGFEEAYQMIERSERRLLESFTAKG